MGYLDDLKRQAEEAKAKRAGDGGALERNTLTTDAACHAAARYMATLAQQLNVLQPMSRAVFRFDSQNEFRNLQLSEFKADSRLKKLRFADVFDHVVLSFSMKTGRKLTLSGDFPPSIEKLEARLLQCGARYSSEIIRDPANGRFLEKRFSVDADFRGTARLIPDHDTGWIEFQVANLDGFSTTTVHFPAIEVGTARLDDLARWITGEPNRFLDGGQGLRRVEL